MHVPQLSKRLIYRIIFILVAINTVATSAVAYKYRHRIATMLADEVDTETAQVRDELAPVDSFAHHKRTRSYVSRLPVGKYGQYLTCVRVLDAVLPVKLSGSDAGVAQLSQTIFSRLQQSDGMTTLDQFYKNVIGTPKFVGTNSGPGKLLSKKPDWKPGIATEYHYIVRPMTSNSRLLCIELQRAWNDGYENHHYFSYLHFDRNTRTIVDMQSILRTEYRPEVLVMLNEKIRHITTKGKLILRPAWTLPKEYFMRKEGLVFLFQEGEIADKRSGEILITLPWKELKPYITADFYRFITEAKHWRDFSKKQKK